MTSPLIFKEDLFIESIKSTDFMSEFLRENRTLSEYDFLYLFRERFQKFFPEDFNKKIRDLLVSGEGICILQGISFDQYSIEDARKILLCIVDSIGIFTYTDELTKQIVWNIAPRKELGVQNTTFSERDGEAEFHTDTQYYPNPEHFFLLACYKKADDGGESIIVDGRKIMKDIQENAPTLFSKLTTIKVPFRVPSSFTRSGSDDSLEIYWATIIDIQKNMFRYRRETIEKGLAYCPKNRQQEIINMIDEFEKFLNKTEYILEFMLEENEIVLCNNHLLFHGRKSFSDQNRLLFRIRFN